MHEMILIYYHYYFKKTTYCIINAKIFKGTNVTTCLVILSSRFYFWKKNRLRRRNPRRTIMGTTDRRGCLVPKYLEFWKLGIEIDSLNFVTKWQDGPSHVWRSVTDSLVEIGSLNLATTCRTDRHRHDEPSWSAVPKHFNSWEFGTGNDSLNVVTEVQDGPS